MKNQSRYLAISLVVFLAIGIFAVAPSLQAQSDQAVKEGQKSIVEGANQMMDGNKKIMAVLEKEGKVDADVKANEKQMKDGYDLVMKGNGMMAGNTMAEGQEMMKSGSKMMLEANNALTVAVEKKGLTKQCAIDLHECDYAAQNIKKGALKWYFGSPGI